jgi:hypothetical protein
MHHPLLEEKIHSVGYVDPPQLETLYSTHHIFIHTATHESYGIAMENAVQYGLPVITCSSGNAQHWVSLNQKSVFVPTIEELADKVIEIATTGGKHEIFATDNHLGESVHLVSQADHSKSDLIWEESCRGLLERIKSVLQGNR